jgi:hypothetical protein
MTYVNKRAAAAYSALTAYEKEIASPRGKAIASATAVRAGRLVLCDLFRDAATIQPRANNPQQSWGFDRKAVIVAVRAGLQALSQQ